MNLDNILKKGLLFSVTTVLLAGCGSNEETTSPEDVEDTPSSEQVEVTIPSYKTGQNVGAELFLGQVERFNEQYEGKYKLNIEEVPQDAYGEQIQQLAQQNDLPVIVHAPGSGSLDNQWFEKVILENDLYHDVSDWLADNPEIENFMIEEFIEFNTTDDGELVSVPDYRVRSPFVYYNEDMYSPDEPIREMNLDQFSDSLGDNKIAFMTGENAWTTGLFWSAIIANEPGGTELLQGQDPGQLVDLMNPIIVSSIEKLKDFMIDHGSSNTVGAIYADAANSFMSKGSALIFNGPWMVGEFEGESSDKWSNDFNGSDVRADYFPGNIGLQNYQAYGDWIPATATDEEKELAEEWFSFLYTPEEMEIALITEGGQTPNFDPSEDYLEKLAENQILSDIQEATTEATTFVPNVLDLLPSSVADSELAKFLPQLLNEQLTVEEFLQELTTKAEQAVN